MTERQNVQTQIAHYTENFLEEHFGKKPDQVTVTLRPPFLLIHLAGFLLPTEELFVQNGREKNVLETRDILIESVKADLLKEFQEYADQKLTDLYADWNLSKRSGLLIVTMEKENSQDEFPWPAGVDKETLTEIILLNSIRTQKKPDQTNFYWLSDQILVVERIGVLVEVEKQLLRNGIIEELRLAKRPMERRIIELFNLESILKSRLKDLFVDWNFHRDASYMVLLLEKQES
jgi:uncharacterized protein YbcI